MEPQAGVDVDDAAALAAAERAQAQQERERRAGRRLRQTVRDMVLSLLVVGVVVMLVAQPWNRPGPVVRNVDWRPVGVAFAGEADFPVLAPDALPPGWQATSVRIEPTVDGRTAWHVGWTTAGDQYAALEQSDTADVRYVATLTDSGSPTGSQLVAGARRWQRLVSADEDTRSLVHTVPGDRPVTYVVTGSADWPELEALAAALTVVAAATPSPGTG